MTQYNFDERIDRKNTNSIKPDFAVERDLPADVLPLWAADMELQIAAGRCFIIRFWSKLYKFDFLQCLKTVLVSFIILPSLSPLLISFRHAADPFPGKTPIGSFFPHTRKNRDFNWDQAARISKRARRRSIMAYIDSPHVISVASPARQNV